MNLHTLVSNCTAAVNPPVTATLKRSTGYTAGPGARRVPTYQISTGKVVVQSLNNPELKHLNGLGITGILSKVYLTGEWANGDRKVGDGGDLLIIDGDTWLMVNVMENWPGWCAVAVAKQVDP